MTDIAELHSVEDRMNEAMRRIRGAAEKAKRFGLSNQRGERFSKGRFDAVMRMTDHWRKFWNSDERKLTPTLLLKPKLDRYAKWYTRAYLWMPKGLLEDEFPGIQSTLLLPQEIDPSYRNMFDLAFRQYDETIRRPSREDGEKTAETVKSSVTIGGFGILLGALAALYFLRGKR